MPSFKNLVGRTFGHWLVVRRLQNIGSSTIWECRCSCGTIKPVRASHLASTASTCCGCVKPAKRTHGFAKGKFSRKYKAWRQIRARCLNPNHKNAAIYSGLLCAAWNSFEQFNKDVPDPPSELHTIERKDNSKGYEPGNVTWATMAEQHRNQSNCRPIEFSGKTQLLTDWAREYKVAPSTIFERMKKWGSPKGR